MRRAVVGEFGGGPNNQCFQVRLLSFRVRALSDPLTSSSSTTCSNISKPMTSILAGLSGRQDLVSRMPDSSYTQLNLL